MGKIQIWNEYFRHLKRVFFLASGWQAFRYLIFFFQNSFNQFRHSDIKAANRFPEWDFLDTWTLSSEKNFLQRIFMKTCQVGKPKDFLLGPKIDFSYWKFERSDIKNATLAVAEIPISNSTQMKTQFLTSFLGQILAALKSLRTNRSTLVAVKRNIPKVFS